jgi:hypothetical protein
MLKLAVLLAVTVALTILGAFQNVVPSAHASSPVSMELYPDGQKVQGAQGAAFSVYVYVHEEVVSTDPSAFEFDLHFDDSILTATSAGGFGYFGHDSVCLPTILTGLVHLACERTDGSSVSGGLWAEIRLSFDFAYSGPVEFDLQDCAVVDIDGDPIALNGCKAGTWFASPVAPPAQMTLSPGFTKVQAVPGTTITVDVLIGAVTDFGGVEFNVSFDASKLTLTNITEGPFQGSLGGETICSFQPPPTPFSNFLCVLLGKEGAVEGSGTVAHIEFTVKVPFTGTTAVSLANCKAADVQGFDIPVDECGEATIQSNPTVTPTPTSTQTPFPVGGLSYDPRGPARSSGDLWPFLVAIAAAGAFAAGGARLAFQRLRS